MWSLFDWSFSFPLFRIQALKEDKYELYELRKQQKCLWASKMIPVLVDHENFMLMYTILIESTVNFFFRYVQHACATLKIQDIPTHQGIFIYSHFMFNLLATSWKKKPRSMAELVQTLRNHLVRKRDAFLQEFVFL